MPEGKDGWAALKSAEAKTNMIEEEGISESREDEWFRAGQRESGADLRTQRVTKFWKSQSLDDPTPECRQVDS